MPKGECEKDDRCAWSLGELAVADVPSDLRGQGVEQLGRLLVHIVNINRRGKDDHYETSRPILFATAQRKSCTLRKNNQCSGRSAYPPWKATV